MKGDFRNTDDSVAVRAALKGLNWHDQMEKARALREERAQNGTTADDSSKPDNLQPIFKQLKRTRANTKAEAEAGSPAPSDPNSSARKPTTMIQRGVRFEAAMSGGSTAPVDRPDTETSSDEISAPSITAKKTRSTEDKLEPTPEETPLEPDGALVLDSPVMDGEVLDAEPERGQNTIVVRPTTGRRKGWRLALGFGFGVGFGIGLSVLIGVGLLGSMLGLNSSGTSTTAEAVSQTGSIGALVETGGRAPVSEAVPQGIVQTSASYAAPLVDTSPPPLLTQFDPSSNANEMSVELAEMQSDVVLASVAGHHLDAPPGLEEPPLIPITAPRTRPSPVEASPQPDAAIVAQPIDTSVPGAERLVAVLNAPARLSGEKVDNAATSLRETGLTLRSVNRVNYKVSADQVRYFHPEDAALASSVADQIGAQARDFTNFRPLPPSGSVEIYLAGNGRSAKRKQVAAAEPVSALRSLRNSIVRTLRP